MAKQIMIVDDDVDNLELMQLVFECAGYDARGCTTGEDIQQVQADDLPDLILLDIKLAEFDGRAICKYLKTNEQTKAVPIIMLCEYVPVKQLRGAYPADDFLTKPFELDTLLDKVERLLS